MWTRIFLSWRDIFEINRWHSSFLAIRRYSGIILYKAILNKNDRLYVYKQPSVKADRGKIDWSIDSQVQWEIAPRGFFPIKSL